MSGYLDKPPLLIKWLEKQMTPERKARAQKVQDMFDKCIRKKRKRNEKK